MKKEKLKKNRKYLIKNHDKFEPINPTIENSPMQPLN